MRTRPLRWLGVLARWLAPWLGVLARWLAPWLGVLAWTALAAIPIVAVWFIILLVRGVAQALQLPAFQPLRDAAWVFLSFAVAIGALTMVSVQISRLMYPVRGRLHRLTSLLRLRS